MEASIALIIGVVILWFWLGRDKYKDYSKSNDTKGLDNKSIQSEVNINKNFSNVDSNSGSVNNTGITNFYDLEKRILLMKELLPHSNKISSEETGMALLNIFTKIFENTNGVLAPKELNKGLTCLELIEEFDIDNDVKENLKSIKSDIKEMAEISSMKTVSINRINDIMNTSERKNNPQNLYEQVLPLAKEILVNSYRRIAFQNGIAPTSKTSDDKIIEIYSKVGSAFKEASKQRNEHIAAGYINTIVLKFFQVYEIGGDIMLDEHLRYEINKYLAEGLRSDYEQELKLI